MSKISEELIEIRYHVDKKIAQFDAAKSLIKKEKRTLQDAKDHLENVREAQNIAQNVASEIQQKAHDQIVMVVRRCLQTIFFDKNYDFKIVFERKRGRTEAILTLIKDGHDISNPLEADSGGVLDIASFALRLSCLVLSKPQVSKVMTLDEPFKHLSPAYRDNACQMLESLAKDFGMQFIMVTQEKEYHIGKVIHI